MPFDDERKATSASPWMVTALLAGILVMSPVSTAYPETVGAQAGLGPLRAHPTNGRYFADRQGNAIYLTGSHTHVNLQDRGSAYPPAEFDYNAYLRFLQDHGHNFMRLWTWESPATALASGDASERYYAPMPYRRPGPGVAADGLPRFDLTQFDQSYFDRLRARVAAARDRGIYAGVMLFQGWSVWHFGAGRNAWAYHPFHPANNINGIDGDPAGDGEGEETHSLQIPEITALQEAYVRKVVDTLNDMDNVLFEVSNETRPSTASRAWEYYMVEYLRRYEESKPNQHPVGVTSNARWDSDVLDSSPSQWVSLRRLNVRDTTLATDPPPADGRRVILLDSDHIGAGAMPADAGIARAWVWKAFTRGYNPILMDDVTNPMADTSPGFVAARMAMGHTARFSRIVNLAAMAPRGDLTSTRFALADPARAYLIYQPERGLFAVDLSEDWGTYAVSWLDPVTGATVPDGTVAGGGVRVFMAPFSTDAVLYLARQ